MTFSPSWEGAKLAPATNALRVVFGQFKPGLLPLAADDQASEVGAFRNPEEANRLVIENAEIRLGPEVLVPMRGDFGRQDDISLEMGGASDNGAVRGNCGHHLPQRRGSVRPFVARSQQSSFG